MIGKQKSALKESIEYLKKGVQLTSEGVYAKRVIGNEDQLPIALHNLAETCIELAYRLEDKAEKVEMFQQAFEHSNSGLGINHRIQSIKKRGQLLCERFLAVYWLDKLSAPLSLSKPEAQQPLLGWVKEKTSAEGYDVEVVLDLMLRTDAFVGDSLESLEEWLGEHGNIE